MKAEKIKNIVLFFADLEIGIKNIQELNPLSDSPKVELLIRMTELKEALCVGEAGMNNKDKIVYHLCVDIGSDSIYYQRNGYDVRLIDRKIGVENAHPQGNVYGVIANPPCTHFSIARTCAKTPRDLQEGMRLVKECLRFIWECQYNTPQDRRVCPLKFWVIENPATGMLKYFLGKPAYQYSPHEFGADFTKKTALWGIFVPPPKPFWLQTLPKGNSIKHKMSILKYKGSFEERRKQQMHDRSMCYEGFAKAFFKANQ